VFVDRTGRRRRLITITGSTGGIVLALVLLALVAGFTGVGPASVPGWPDAVADAGHGVRPKPSTSRAVPAARPRPRTVTPTLPRPTTGGAPARSTAPAPVASTSPAAGATPLPSISATPTATPKNNGRKPSQKPHPHSSKKN
jgi:hypothetical protein